MINCILIQNNNINEIKVKNLSEDSIYKKCNFKNNSDFLKIKTWNYKNNIIELWGKNKGFSSSLSEFELFLNNSINIYGKSIFLMKSNEDKYISIDKDNFVQFLKLNTNNNNEVFNIENEEKLKEVNNKDNINKNAKNDLNIDNYSESSESSEFSNNSELTYELYEYSDED
tara:strand:- start:1991 stop:2503 length:513 start_codon:yes stop_codon:yes gene_type:complete